VCLMAVTHELMKLSRQVDRESAKPSRYGRKVLMYFRLGSNQHILVSASHIDS